MYIQSEKFITTVSNCLKEHIPVLHSDSCAGSCSSKPLYITAVVDVRCWYPNLMAEEYIKSVTVTVEHNMNKSSRHRTRVLLCSRIKVCRQIALPCFSSNRGIRQVADTSNRCGQRKSTCHSVLLLSYLIFSFYDLNPTMRGTELLELYLFYLFPYSTETSFTVFFFSSHIWPFVR